MRSEKSGGSTKAGREPPPALKNKNRMDNERKHDKIKIRLMKTITVNDHNAVE
jgi:hypothetical protein